MARSTGPCAPDIDLLNEPPLADPAEYKRCPSYLVLWKLRFSAGALVAKRHAPARRAPCQAITVILPSPLQGAMTSGGGGENGNRPHACRSRKQGPNTAAVSREELRRAERQTHIHIHTENWCRL